MHRRTFMCSAGLSAFTAANAAGSNDRLNIGLIGCGGRGLGVAKSMRDSAPNVAYTAVADVYAANAEKARTWAGAEAKTYADFRKMLDDRDVDAVHIATPDHWHSIATVLACQAGKDVYVEKPIALTVREGRVMVDAARKYKRIVQAGTQHRSAPHFRKIGEIIQRGDIGPVKFVRVWNYANHTLKPMQAQQEPVPDGLDWDMYLGPSPRVPFDRRRFLSTYRYFWDYSGGYITDFGNHRIDTMQQIMNVTAPHTVSASGGVFVMNDGRETPDLMMVTWEYDGFIATYEGCNLNGHGVGGRTPGHRYYNARGDSDQPNGIAFYGTDATIYAERIGWEIFPENGKQPAVKRMWENVEEPTKAHCRDFVESVRARKTPAADIEIGQRGTTTCLLGNIAMRTGRKLKWDPKTETFAGDAGANAMLTRTLRKPYDWIKL